MNARRSQATAVLQARFGSSRLRGKVLRPLMGVPMLLRQIERLKRCNALESIIVATSTETDDDAVAEIALSAGVQVVRGSLDDVFQRFVQVASEHSSDVMVRITADCPLISPRVIDDVVDFYFAANADYVSNTLIPTYPDGLDVEVFKTELLDRLAREDLDTAEQEHVTLGIYRRPDQFRVVNYLDPMGRDHADLRWTVDTEEDFDFVETVYSHFLPSKPHFEYEDILLFLTENPDLSRTQAHSPRNAALEGLDTWVMRHQQLENPS
jgi:spore coat polysaccharide biosynthesis protein SpsF